MNLLRHWRTALLALCYLLSINSAPLYAQETYPRLRIPAPEIIEPLQTLSHEETAWIKRHPKLRVVAHSDFPPIEWCDSHGDLQGTTAQLLKQFAHFTGISLEVIFCKDWKKIETMLREGQADLCLSLNIDKQRSQYLLQSVPYLTTPVVFITSRKIHYLTNLKHTLKHPIVVVRGNFISKFFHQNYPDLQLIEVNTLNDGIRYIAEHETAVFIDQLLSASFAITSNQSHDVHVAGISHYICSFSFSSSTDHEHLTSIASQVINTLSSLSYRTFYPDLFPEIIRQANPWQHNTLIALVGLCILLATLASILLILALTRKRKNRIQLLINALNQTQNPILIVMPDKTLFFVNRAASKIFSITDTTRETLNQTILPLLNPEFTSPKDAESLTKAHAKHLPWRGDIVIHPADATVHPFTASVAMTPITLKNNTFAAHAVTLRDITLTLRKNKEKEDITRQLQHANKMESISRFTQTITTELINTLQTVTSYTELLRQTPTTPALSPLLKNTIDAIGSDIHRGAKILQPINTLSFTTPTESVPQIINPNNTIADFIPSLRHLLPAKISLQWVPTERPYPILIDEIQLTQILSNLCTNARDAMKGIGTITLSTYPLDNPVPSFISSGELPPGQYTRISISDTGSGIPHELQAKIFEPFFTTKPSGKGTGLGLSIIYNFMEQCHGGISFESQINVGTTFHLFFPAAHQASTANEAPRQAQPTPIEDSHATPIPDKQEKILLFTPHAQNLHPTRRLLENLNYRVLFTDDPKECSAILQIPNSDISLLLADISQKSSPLAQQFTNAINRRQAPIPVLFLLNFTENNDRESPAPITHQHTLSKPFTINQLATQLNHLLTPTPEPPPEPSPEPTNP